MLMAKNRQLKLNPTNFHLQKLLRLCYFILMVFLLGCGSDKTKLHKTKQNQDPRNF